MRGLTKDPGVGTILMILAALVVGFLVVAAQFEGRSNGTDPERYARFMAAR